jgi:hypothetical protein
MNIKLKKSLAILSILGLCGAIKPIYNITYKNNHAIKKNILTTVTTSNPITFHSPLSSFFDDSVPAMSLNRNAKKDSLVFIAGSKTSLESYGAKYFLEGPKMSRPNFSFSNHKAYSTLEGVTCFRGNSMRDSGSYGNVVAHEGKLNILWTKNIGSIDSWTGVGWNGQPSIVKWDKDVIKTMNINKEKKDKYDLKEVIYATLDGNVYFLDLEDGKETRDKLKIGAPIKGSLTVDPRGIPLLYVGQGIDTANGSYVDFAYRIFSLTDFKKLYEIKGKDNFARRDWGAFDSTSLIDAYNDYLFVCGENGVFYSGALNTKYENGKVDINPKIDKYRYDVPGKEKRGIENSIAIYKNYGYFADNDGMLQCVNLNTLSPVWISDVGDDTDSTVVLEKEEDALSLYTACEVDHQGISGYSYVRKIDGTSGRVLWENKYKCAYNEDVNGGALATPIMGKEDISNLVIFNIARTPSYNSGVLVAIDKTTGKEVWNLKLNNYCWSSPVALYTVEGKSYVVQCDSTGTAMLIEGSSGKILDKLELGANVEGSPSAFGNTLVVGTRGGKIIGFEVK